jgi:hypothetical protein
MDKLKEYRIVIQYIEISEDTEVEVKKIGF